MRRVTGMILNRNRIRNLKIQRAEIRIAMTMGHRCDPRCGWRGLSEHAMGGGGSMSEED